MASRLLEVFEALEFGWRRIKIIQYHFFTGIYNSIKTNMKKTQKKSQRIVDESFDSSWLTQEQREEGAKLTGDFIAKQKAGWTQQDHLESSMLQLKFLIEDYIKSGRYESKQGFAFFLKEYIRRQDKKNSQFAKEISISAVELSQLVNKHREPNWKIIVRLAAHSNQNFPAIMWFNLHMKDKSVELLENEKLAEREGKFVKKGLGFKL